jgi:hypothetical protein
VVVAPGLVAENVWLRQQLEGAWSHNDFNARSDISPFVPHLRLLQNSVLSECQSRIPT